jgi:hypothetical protein
VRERLVGKSCVEFRLRRASFDIQQRKSNRARVHSWARFAAKLAVDMNPIFSFAYQHRRPYADPVAPLLKNYLRTASTDTVAHTQPPQI